MVLRNPLTPLFTLSPACPLANGVSHLALGGHEAARGSHHQLLAGALLLLLGGRQVAQANHRADLHQADDTRSTNRARQVRVARCPALGEGGAARSQMSWVGAPRSLAGTGAKQPCAGSSMTDHDSAASCDVASAPRSP